MEELVLTDPVVEPAKTTNKFRVISLTLDMETMAGPPPTPPAVPEPGMILINLKDNNGKPYNHTYTGKAATDMIKFLNTANLTTKSMHKRILEKLSTDGLLPGSVTGTPDPPTGTALKAEDEETIT